LRETDAILVQIDGATGMDSQLQSNIMARTFKWFESQATTPSEYEELTVNLFWGTDTLVSTELGTWSQDSTALSGVDWEQLRDPAQLHYRTYVARQSAAERELDAVLTTAVGEGFVQELDRSWRRDLAVLLGGGAFAEWGVAMAMQTVQRFSLSSTVAQCAQLQVCDELRHAQRYLEWADLIFAEDAVQGDRAKAAWMEAPCLQGLRRRVEDILVLTDWAEVVLALGLILEGLLQPYIREVCITGGRRHADLATAALGRQCWTDELRHLAWCDTFVRLALSEAANTSVLTQWCARHVQPSLEAVRALAADLPFDGIAGPALELAEAEFAKRLENLDLDGHSWRA